MSRRGPWIVGAGIVLVLTLVWAIAWRARDTRPLALRPESPTSAPLAVSPAGRLPPRSPGDIEPRPPASTGSAAATPASPGPVASSTRSNLRKAPAVDGTWRDEARYPATPVLPPDDAVGEIRRLLGRGERAEALRQLRDLRRRHPRYDLPQDLLDLRP